MHTTTPGHSAALCGILFAAALAAWNSWGVLSLMHGTLSVDAVYLGLSMMGVLVVCYLVWLLLVLRHKLTPATGGGLSLAAYALCLRYAARCGESVLPYYGRTHMQDEPVYEVLDAAYGLSVVVYVAGLAFVLAACIAEWHLRRAGPDWAVPE